LYQHGRIVRPLHSSGLRRRWLADLGVTSAMWIMISIVAIACVIAYLIARAVLAGRPERATDDPARQHVAVDAEVAVRNGHAHRGPSANDVEEPT
jgi:hypothetical protein